MRISECLTKGEPSFSFEFFPPKTDEATDMLERTIVALRPLAPNFVSVTYGAGGSTRERTIDLAIKIKQEAGIEAMAHLTCVGHSRAELRALLDRLKQANIENIMALRGDPPAGVDSFEPAPDGLRYGSELIRFIHDEGFDFCVGGAAYPEGHVESENRYDDVWHLAHKAEAGASFFISQLFFDNAFFFDFVERVRRLGVTAPILAGIMPITNADQIQRFSRKIGATIPSRLTRALERCESQGAVRELGVEWATEQCKDLLEQGVPGIHFYTLNRSTATQQVLANLGRVPA